MRKLQIYVSLQAPTSNVHHFQPNAKIYSAIFFYRTPGNADTNLKFLPSDQLDSTAQLNYSAFSTRTNVQAHPSHPTLIAIHDPDTHGAVDKLAREPELSGLQFENPESELVKIDGICEMGRIGFRFWSGCTIGRGARRCSGGFGGL